MHAQKSTSSMRAILTCAAAAFAVSASACDSVPTAPEEHVPVMAAMSNGSQPRVALCHRTTTGDYVKITVADAAYDTHMAHGDRNVGLYGECQIFETSRLTVHNGGWLNGPDGDRVLVTVLAFGGAPDTQLPDCSGSCSYDVPTGATVSLSGVPEFTGLAYVGWEECSSAYPAQQATVTCVVNRNMAASVGPAY